MYMYFDNPFFQAFGPIANVAKKIVEKNGFGEKISVIGKRSTDLELKKGEQNNFRPFH